MGQAIHFTQFRKIEMEITFFNPISSMQKCYLKKLKKIFKKNWCYRHTCRRGGKLHEEHFPPEISGLLP